MSQKNNDCKCELHKTVCAWQRLSNTITEASKILKDEVNGAVEEKIAKVIADETVEKVKVLQRQLSNVNAGRNSKETENAEFSKTTIHQTILDKSDVETKGFELNSKESRTFLDLTNQIFIPEFVLTEKETEMRKIGTSETENPRVINVSNPKTKIILFKYINRPQMLQKSFADITNFSSSLTKQQNDKFSKSHLEEVMVSQNILNALRSLQKPLLTINNNIVTRVIPSTIEAKNFFINFANNRLEICNEHKEVKPLDSNKVKESEETETGYKVKFLTVSDFKPGISASPDLDKMNVKLTRVKTGFFFFPTNYIDTLNADSENQKSITNFGEFALNLATLDLRKLKLNENLYLPNEDNIAIKDVKFGTFGDVLAWTTLNPSVQVVVKDNIYCPLEKCDFVFEVKNIFIHMYCEHAGLLIDIIQRNVSTRFDVTFNANATFEALLLFNEIVSCDINDIKNYCTPFICKAVPIQNLYGSYSVLICILGLENNISTMNFSIDVQSNIPGYEHYSKQLTNSIIDMHNQKDMISYFKSGHALLLTEYEIIGLTANGTVPAQLHVTLL